MVRGKLSQKLIHFVILTGVMLFFMSPVSVKAYGGASLIPRSGDNSNGKATVQKDYVWWNHAWNYRVKSSVQGRADSNSYTTAEINFTSFFSRLGSDWLTLDENSIRVIEYDFNGIIKDKNVIFMFQKNENFNPKNYALGHISWRVKEETSNTEIRLFYIYFDTLENGQKRAPYYDFSRFDYGKHSNKYRDNSLNGISPKTKKGTNQSKYLDLTVSLAPEKLRATKYPEVRGIWYHLLSEKSGISEIQLAEDMMMLKECGFNAVFVWISNLYAEALRNPGRYSSELPHVLWDSLKVLIKNAQKCNLNVHMWYSPNNNKESYRATELRDHPEWAILDRDLRPINQGIDLAIREAQDYEKSIILYLVERYNPEGFHVEEPYYQYSDLINSSYTTAFRDLVRVRFGFDPLFHSINEELDAAISHTKEEIIFNFFSDLRETLSTASPFLVLSANGPWSGYTKQGFNLIRLAENHIIDFYVPQIYTRNPNDYKKKLSNMVETMSNYIHIYGGTAIKWASLLGGWNSKEAFEKQIDIAHSIGTSGIVFFSFLHSINSPYFDVFQLIKNKPVNYEVTNGFYVKGKVIHNGAPVEHAIVRTLDQETTTDNQGRYVYHVLPGSHSVEVHVEGSKVLEEHLNVHGNTHHDLIVQYIPRQNEKNKWKDNYGK